MSVSEDISCTASSPDKKKHPTVPPSRKFSQTSAELIPKSDLILKSEKVKEDNEVDEHCSIRGLFCLAFSRAWAVERAVLLRIWDIAFVWFAARKHFSCVQQVTLRSATSSTLRNFFDVA